MGEWGRPGYDDDEVYRLSLQNKTFSLYNYGKHHRDFTYIGDVTKIMFTLLKNKKLKPADIYNICSNRPVSLKSHRDNEKNKIKPKIKKLSLQQADIIKTHGNNKN